jgi:NADPH:quinone reductase-like Zn-dependent oxidoreductase
MKAITRTSYGDSSVLTVKDIPKPIPKGNEVLVRVFCTTVNRTDCGILTGKPFLIRFFTGLFKPSSLVPGTDFSGEVMAIGEKVTQFNIGDRVWGLNDEGLASQAEYMTIKEHKNILLMPDNVSHRDVLSGGEGAHYAYNFINKIKLTRGDKVLVNGATGAIGIAAVQILKDLGVYVTAVGNTKNIEMVKSLGVDKIYNYELEDFTEVDKEQYHFIFDAVGKSSFGECKHLLLPTGTYLSSELGPKSENLYLPLITKLKGGKRVIFPIPKDCKKSLLYMNDLFERGKIKPVIDRMYKPEDIKVAYDYAASGQKTGNIIINF